VDPGSDRSELVGTIPKAGDDAVGWSITMTQDILPPSSVAKEWCNVKEKVVFLPIILHHTSRGNGTRRELAIKGLALRRIAGTSNLFTRIGTVKLRFWTSTGNRESWQDYLGCVATGMAEKIVTIV
jgi:hypothetical protein